MGDGVRVVCVWFWAPIMHRMSGRTLAWHFARCCGHVHLSTHSGIVSSGALLLIVHVLVSVKNGCFYLLGVFV